MSIIDNPYYVDESKLNSFDISGFGRGHTVTPKPQATDGLIPISLDDELQAGDEIVIKIKSAGPFTAIAKTIFENKYDKDRRFTVLSSTYDLDSNAVIKCRVNDLTGTQFAGTKITAGLLVAAITGVALIVFSVSAYKTVGKVGEIVNTTGGKVAIAGISLTSIAAAITIGIWLLKGR